MDGEVFLLIEIKLNPNNWPLLDNFPTSMVTLKTEMAGDWRALAF